MAGDPVTREITSYHANGQIAEKYSAFDAPGTVIRHGLTTAWYASGALYHMWRFHLGKLEGAQETWYENGQQWTVRHYRADVQEGAFSMWHPNGAKGVEATYAHGVPVGGYVGWWSDDKSQFARTYDQYGQLTGPCRAWNEQGELVVDEVY